MAVTAPVSATTPRFVEPATVANAGSVDHSSVTAAESAPSPKLTTSPFTVASPPPSGATPLTRTNAASAGTSAAVQISILATS